MIQFFSRKLKNRKGFTIIELLVVIALLGILAGIAVPRMTGITDTAKQKADDASMMVLLKDTQAAVASGALDMDNEKHITTAGVVQSGNADAYFIDAFPVSQMSKKNFTVTLTETPADSGIYNITVSDDNATAADIRTKTGVVEVID